MVQVLSSALAKFPSPSDTIHRGDVSWPSCGMSLQKFLNVFNYFRDAMLFLQDVSGELRWPQVHAVILAAWILTGKSAATGQPFGRWHLPCALIFLGLV